MSIFALSATNAWRDGLRAVRISVGETELVPPVRRQPECPKRRRLHHDSDHGETNKQNRRAGLRQDDCVQIKYARPRRRDNQCPVETTLAAGLRR